MRPQERMASGTCYVSIVSSVSLDVFRFEQLLDWLRGMVEERRFGWTRVLRRYATTDVPEQCFEVYRLPRLASLPDTLEALEQEPNYRELLRFCRSRQMELMRAMPYDPGAEGAPRKEQDYLLQSILTLKEEQQPLFLQNFERARPLFQGLGWSLVSASRSLAPPDRVMHLWQFNDADAMYKLIGNPKPEPPVAALEACCEAQWHRLLHNLRGATREE
jgi:hypothetical protein